MVPGPLPYARGELRSAASKPRWSQTKEVEMTRDSTGWSSNAVIIEHIERIISSLGGSDKYFFNIYLSIKYILTIMIIVKHLNVC